MLITGAIGSGKSEVCHRLCSLGFPIYDCDSRTKALYDSVPGLRNRIEETLEVPMSQLGIIFSDASKRKALEALVYPEVLKDLSEWKADQTADILFMESAIALEKPEFDAAYDEVWLVRAPYGDRLRRNPMVAERTGSQAPIDPARADVIIDNDSSLEDLYKKIDTLIYGNKEN